MNALTEMLAQHKAVRKDMRLLGFAGEEYEAQHDKAVQKSDRIVRKLAKMSCASDDEFFAKLEHIAKVEFEDYGYPEGGNYEGVVIAVRTYLKRRKKAQAASLRRVREQYCRPGTLQRGLKILAQELDAHQASAVSPRKRPRGLSDDCRRQEDRAP
jgi:hypothetical protein